MALIWISGLTVIGRPAFTCAARIMLLSYEGAAQIFERKYDADKINTVLISVHKY
jgi:hypothetical protein